MIVGAVAIVVLALLGPSNSSKPFDGRLAVTCAYNIKVVVFTDANSDGLQTSDESGIAGVAVMLQPSLPQQSTPEQMMTDASGLVTFSKNDYCPDQNMVSISAVAPSGYSATTPLSFGPYPVAVFTSQYATQVAQNPIPKVIYIGLHKN
ncbi:MAG: hypothetical protein H0X30_21725 [Anaerolineae bacterium]|nr:hypothetical protein [Anaerolineae bacterium]